MDGLKKRLEVAKGKWVDELPHALCAYCTMPKISIRETPFSMTYGTKIVIPLETSFPTMRTNQFDNSNNEQLLSTSLDLAEGRREICTIRLA